MFRRYLYLLSGRTSHEVRGLKFLFGILSADSDLSHLTRGAWIEIAKYIGVDVNYVVAPHTRCVD